MVKPRLVKKVQQFIDDLDAKGGKPLYEMTPEQARGVLSEAQKGDIKMPEVEIEQIEIPAAEDRKLTLEIIRPKKDEDDLPVVYYIHGGGWVMGDNLTHRRLVAELAAGIPAAIVFPIYTPAPEGQFPEVTDDLFAGLQYVAKHGKQLGLDASRLAVAGDSVGGNMAAVMTLMAKQNGFKPKIDYQVLLYPVTNADFETLSYQDFAEGPWLTKKAMEWFWQQYLPDEDERQQILASPLTAEPEDLEGLPPALIITDENDVLRDEGEAYARKLDAAGVRVAAVRFNGTIHDFMMLNAISDSVPTRTAIALVKAKLHWALYQQ